tara:strand:+ start:443 stop:772 length:330 start_codon:yes stop_codon:yes gene_type:complete
VHLSAGKGWMSRHPGKQARALISKHLMFRVSFFREVLTPFSSTNIQKRRLDSEERRAATKEKDKLDIDFLKCQTPRFRYTRLNTPKVPRGKKFRAKYARFISPTVAPWW